MEKWHTQFDKLRRQWSDYNWLDNQYKPHSKQLVAKIGVAWVVKIPEADFQEPVGWEVEIIDTPVGISERSHKLIKWLRNPPHFYDRLSTYNDFSNSVFDEPYWIKKDVRPLGNHALNLTNYWPNETFTIPPNEYEIFKKTCCQCKERAFKNTSTNYDSDMTASRLTNSKNQSPTEISKRFPLEQKNEDHKKFDKTINTVANQNTHRDIEREINDQIINDSKRFSRSDHGYNHTKDHSKMANSKYDPDNTRISTLADKNIETSKVNRTGEKQANRNQGRSSRSIRTSSLEDQILSKESIDNWDGYRNPRNSGYKETGTQNKLETSSRKHIPSIDVFDDDILTGGASLEDYREFENDIFNKTSEETNNKSPKLNSTRNYHRHHYDENQSKENVQNMSKVNFVPSKNVIGNPKMVDAEANVTIKDLTQQ